VVDLVFVWRHPLRSGAVLDRNESDRWRTTDRPPHTVSVHGYLICSLFPSYFTMPFFEFS
jgi:hypothetical protein